MGIVLCCVLVYCTNCPDDPYCDLFGVPEVVMPKSYLGRLFFEPFGRPGFRLLPSLGEPEATLPALDRSHDKRQCNDKKECANSWLVWAVKLKSISSVSSRPRRALAAGLPRKTRPTASVETSVSQARGVDYVALSR